MSVNSVLDGKGSTYLENLDVKFFPKYVITRPQNTLFLDVIEGTADNDKGMVTVKEEVVKRLLVNGLCCAILARGEDDQYLLYTGLDLLTTPKEIFARDQVGYWSIKASSASVCGDLEKVIDTAERYADKFVDLAVMERPYRKYKA